MFGSLEYYIEMEEEDTGFYSIPQGMWWAVQVNTLFSLVNTTNTLFSLVNTTNTLFSLAVQTLTSLGYGDFPVQTIPGTNARSQKFWNASVCYAVNIY